jgi:hypothetical protein
MQAELLTAIDAALSDRWDDAHAIVQRYEHDAVACWIHAVLHKIEGDAGNSRYWYARSGGHAYEDTDDTTAELRAIATTLKP